MGLLIIGGAGVVGSVDRTLSAEESQGKAKAIQNNAVNEEENEKEDLRDSKQAVTS